MNIDPKKIDDTAIYKLLVGSVMPRPIAWISTKGLDGKLNLAPYSFFNIASRNPPTIAISISHPKVKTKLEKDTLKNIKDTKELVVNIVTKDLVDSMNISASEVPLDMDEFEMANLSFANSEKINVPRVAKAKISMECICKKVIPIGIDTLILAEVVNFNISDEVIQDGKIQIDLINVVGRIAGPNYCNIDNSFKMITPKPDSFF